MICLTLDLDLYHSDLLFTSLAIRDFHQLLDRKLSHRLHDGGHIRLANFAGY